MFFFSTTVFHSETGENILLQSKINSKSQKENDKQIIKIIEKENNLKFKYSLAIKIAVLRKFLNLALVPIPFSNFLANKLKGNKYGGWHCGGTLPFSQDELKTPFCKSNGELEKLKNVFIVDSSSFSSIPGSTVALLTMANAFRITKNSLK
tara:strand:+ start:245 stop:697 length:453 start_codon:yes stop_codon:yes gene_type:complete